MARRGADTAVFLVRVWWEDGDFRARITHDVGDGVVTRLVTADPDEVVGELRAWLEEVCSPSS
ncbi:hypothetical protein [Pseudonocardia sp. D17]|jgi:hypothetical protein|uniref:hypothetical protein n=1 Tax=Pseudonocardia sp. D17 TaxID=882661 RepID=UPI002B395691|nr:hypothetical protein PSD17_05350 [Pseudonocardia sp. D17]